MATTEEDLDLLTTEFDSVMTAASLRADWTSKRFAWVPHETAADAFQLCQIQREIDGDDAYEVRIMKPGEILRVSRDDVHMLNPPSNDTMRPLLVVNSRENEMKQREEELTKQTKLLEARSQSLDDQLKLMRETLHYHDGCKKLLEAELVEMYSNWEEEKRSRKAERDCHEQTLLSLREELLALEAELEKARWGLEEEKRGKKAALEKLRAVEDQVVLNEEARDEAEQETEKNNDESMMMMNFMDDSYEEEEDIDASEEMGESSSHSEKEEESSNEEASHSKSTKKKRRVFKRSDTEMKCIECAYRTTTASSFESHIRRKHDTTLKLAGIVLRCGCEHESSSYHHSLVCDVANFTVIRKNDEPIRRLKDVVVPQVKCILCEFCPKTPIGYICHLKRKHKEKNSLKRNGIFLRCEECHHKFVQSDSRLTHSKECEGTQFSVHELEKVSTPKCLLCEKYPTTALGYAAHLTFAHKSTLIANNVYLRCSCEHIVRSSQGDPNHTKKCGGRQYTLHKINE